MSKDTSTHHPDCKMPACGIDNKYCPDCAGWQRGDYNKAPCCYWCGGQLLAENVSFRHAMTGGRFLDFCSLKHNNRFIANKIGQDLDKDGNLLCLHCKFAIKPPAKPFFEAYLRESMQPEFAVFCCVEHSRQHSKEAVPKILDDVPCETCKGTGLNSNKLYCNMCCGSGVQTGRIGLSTVLPVQVSDPILTKYVCTWCKDEFTSQAPADTCSAYCAVMLKGKKEGNLQRYECNECKDTFSHKPIEGEVAKGHIKFYCSHNCKERWFKRQILSDDNKYFTKSSLICLIYLLLRDEMPVGKLESIIVAASKDTDKVLSNYELAIIAKQLSEKLK